ncbi:hypothetical protein TraAM80_06341 [Trypanosoma rangeli]|uniref:Uncharacterized protein n=1 Tax=Trypanosoma rangeli TaxID=5698 RepID=A0A422NAR9_TRYRA|nr:uncharacterized protein TraAM80_06341 [Trypanosoma rangeli]RNF02516.1 hypothetical protein TraAM80_06341 [Trypanosoma rangeli]|eukprot:RNF02516.1 hypothetical protein TraAM80_06341 [Trypanosoma rangeli]
MQCHFNCSNCLLHLRVAQDEPATAEFSGIKPSPLQRSPIQPISHTCLQSLYGPLLAWHSDHTATERDSTFLSYCRPGASRMSLLHAGVSRWVGGATREGGTCY